MASILIKNGRVWDGETFQYADVLTDGQQIAKIASGITDHADFVYDAGGLLVSPGLVDAHVHIKGVTADAFGIHAEMSSFPFGVTAVNNAGSISGEKAFLDLLAVKNTVFAGVGIRDHHAELSSAEERLHTYGGKGIGLKVYFDTEITEVQDITPLQEICDYAKANSLKVMVHCSNSPTSMAEIVDTLSPGDILTHIYHGGKNTCTENGFEAFRLAKQKGVVLDAGFAGHVHTDFANLKAAIREGFLPDTISTDITRFSAFMRGGRYGMTMCMNIARHAGMREEDILRAVTATPAKVLGKEDRWGHLQAGRCADIAVFAYTNEGFDLTDHAGNRIQSAEGYRCILTVAGGQVVFRD